MNKTLRYIIYVIAIMICTIVLILAIYFSFIKKDENVVMINNVKQNIISASDTKETQELFDNEFTNKFEKGNFDDSQISKEDASKEMVYLLSNDGINPTVIQSDNKDFTAYIPMFNINNDICKEYNNKIIGLVTDLNQYLGDESVKLNGKISFSANIYGNILSVAIKLDYKKGDDPQRVIFQTYNYDLEKGASVTIKDIITQKGLNSEDMNTKIKETVEQASADAEAMSKSVNSGYEIYKRDTTSKLYDITSDEAQKDLLFILGKQGELYIIYAYGNENATNQFDIIKF